MILNKNTSKKTAEFLLQIKAIKLNPNNPFLWSSGWRSPIYCDNRISLSHHSTRTFIREQIGNLIIENFGRPDAIAGVATGGIPHGILVAQQLALPFIYVRPKPKNHGTKNQIEGLTKKGQKIVVIEDLISTGKSSLKAVEIIKNHGCIVKGVVAIFNYGFEIAVENFKKSNCELISLTNYNDLIDKATEIGYINESEIEDLKEWRKNPTEWKTK
tara:strand:+ start:5291 stop:5935 length:645 start_codon:yes stop_codon:yes gene_type:complete